MQKPRIMKFFTDRAYLLEGIGHCSLLKPYWGDPETHNGYENFTNNGKEFLQMTEPEEAEIAILPFDASYLLEIDPAVSRKAREVAGRFVSAAAEKSLPTLMLCNSDSSARIGFENTIVLRTAIDRWKQAPGEYALPGWFEDLVSSHMGGSIVVRPKSDVPVVGFCGLAATRDAKPHRKLIDAAKSLANRAGFRIPHKSGLFLRKRALDALGTQPGLKTNFLIRDQFFGGHVNTAGRDQVRREYIDNLVSSDYVLCVRGNGNYSFRFFETMSVGRIPVLIDTDCVLPYDFLHDYKKSCVIVPETEIDQVGQHVLDFHARLSHDDFREIQERNRRFWVEWLSPEGYFSHMSLHWDSSCVPAGSAARGTGL